MDSIQLAIAQNAEGGLKYKTARQKSLSWIINHLQEFSPLDSGNGFGLADAKKLGELALMAYCYQNLSANQAAADIQPVVEFLRRAVDHRAVTDRLMRRPREIELHLGFYAMLNSLGQATPIQLDMIRKALKLNLPLHVERTPVQMMDLRMSLEWAGLDYALPDWQEMLRLSILGRTPHAVLLDEHAIYSLTHDIMFIYGFGTKTAASQPSLDLPALRHCLINLIVCMCQEGHWDLLGELLISWNCLGCESIPVVDLAWQALLAAQEEDGAIPSRQLAGEETTDEADAVRTNAERDDYFMRRYHSTLVFIIAATLQIERLGASATTVLPIERGQSAPAIGSTRTTEFDTAILAAARQAHVWLWELLSSADARDQLQPTSYCNLLLGIWICDSLLHQGSRAFVEPAQRVWRGLLAERTSQSTGRSKPQPSLRLMTAILLAAYGLHVPDLDDFLSQATEALQSTPEDETSEGLLFFDKRFLLHYAGLLSRPKTLPLADLLAFAGRLSLPWSSTDVEAMELRIMSLTACGSLPAVLPASYEWLEDILVGLATHRLRQYDLHAACKTMRSLQYLSLDGTTRFAQCTEYLLAHQRHEGCFGYFGIEEGNSAFAHMADAFVPEMDLYLPTTIECLWTLAERHSSAWRLYTSFPRRVEAGLDQRAVDDVLVVTHH